jgi:hypothetical protein
MVQTRSGRRNRRAGSETPPVVHHFRRVTGPLRAPSSKSHPHRLSGLYKGLFGPHGCEILSVSYDFSGPAAQIVATKITGGDGELQTCCCQLNRCLFQCMQHLEHAMGPSMIGTVKGPWLRTVAGVLPVERIIWPPLLMLIVGFRSGRWSVLHQHLRMNNAVLVPQASALMCVSAALYVAALRRHCRHCRRTCLQVRSPGARPPPLCILPSAHAPPLNRLER